MAEMDNIVLEHLRHIRGALDDVRDDIGETFFQLNVKQSRFSGLFINAQYRLQTPLLQRSHGERRH